MSSRELLGCVVVLCVSVVSACGGSDDGSPDGTAATGRTSDGETTVVSVVDGDTVDVRMAGGATERVRIVGINAPEHDECLAAESTAAMTRLVDRREVTLVRDHSDRDRYGRLLRYVETTDGTDVGLELVRRGLALSRVSAPDDARADEINKAEAESRSSHVGVWAPNACGPVASGEGDLRIVGLRLDADGDDARNLNDEWVDIENAGDAPIDLGGWKVRDESSSHRYSFPAHFRLGAGARVRLHSGCGEDTGAELFWCESGSAVWNNDGDTAYLVDPAGNLVAQRQG